jgi:cystathionine beta-lyase/cystathionine gamma-synthase
MAIDLFGGDINTLAIHGGQSPDPTTGAILTPVYQSTTYAQEAVGVHKGFTYTRCGNPTVAALERSLGELEGALPAACFSTGLAAITGLFLSELEGGGHVVVSDVVYGGTVRLLRQVLGKFGVSATYVDASDTAEVARAITKQTKLVLVETPGNPTLKLCDIAAVAKVTKAAGVPLAVDNTFLTAVLQRPLDLGADISIYSTTKYIEGHNATVGGALVTRDAALLERLRLVQRTIGAVLAPWEAWLTIRGIKTLPLRLARHSESALKVAKWLESRPEVASVACPGLDSFPQHALAKQQQGAGGGIIAFELRGGLEAGVRLMNSVKLCTLAENLGAAETLVTHPTSMTHGSLTPAERAAAGITDGLVRLSVGLEGPDDIIADLAQALAVASTVTPAIEIKPVKSEPESKAVNNTIKKSKVDPSTVLVNGRAS